MLAAGAAFALLGWAAWREPPLDVRVLELFADLPGWIRNLAWAAYTLAGLSAIGLLFVAVLRGGVGRGVVRDIVLSLALVSALSLATSRAVTGTWPAVLPELSDPTGRLAFPTVRTTLVVVVTLVLAPHVTQSVRRLGRWMVAASVVSPLLLGLTTVTTLLGALTLAFLGVGLIRVVFGSPEGLPPVGRLGDALARLGVDVTELAYDDEQPGTFGLAGARSSNGQLTIKVYGQDAADRERLERVWRALWYRGGGPRTSAGRLEQVEHEALATLIAAREGLRVSELVEAGQEPGGDALLVVVEPSGHRLGDPGAEAPSDAALEGVWRGLLRLHDARLSHGSVSPETILLDGDEAGFVDFQHASLAATERELAADVVALLGTTAIVTDVERSLAAALAHCGRERLEGVLPFVQEAIVEPGLRKRMKEAGASPEVLRAGLVEALEVDAPELAPIRRASLGDVVMVVFAIFAANALISQIASVGFDSIVDELRDASTGWLVAAFIIKLLGYCTALIGLRAIVTQPLPFAPVALLQSAKSYVGLILPSLAGRVAMDVRFLQKLGVPTPVALAQGPIISFVGFLVEVALLAVGAWAIGQELESDELFEFDSAGLLALALVVVVAGVGIFAASPKLRSRVLPPVRAALSSVREVVTSPGRLGRIALGELLDRLVGALALAATLEAFGVDLPFAALVFASVGTGLLAGLAPVPGGVGVAEATMTALLTGVGVPAETAFSVAIVFRLVTSYLPPVLGFFSTRWLAREGYI
ncbi:MAG: lysylphosphatidylglycerol synthase transmembrane domain-containing protein [Actinomycetota bacterium]